MSLLLARSFDELKSSTMNKFGVIFISFLSCLYILGCENPSDESKENPPNILLIIADDLGYTDLGCYGSEIRTPNIDQLAQNGIRNTSFCTAPTCSPARAMLLSGVVSHRNGYGTMEGDWADNQRGVRGYEGHLNFDVVAFPKLLQDAGYHTSIAGKWHQAYPPNTQELWPNHRGFTRSFCLAQGGAGHFEDKQPLLEQMGEALYISDGQEVAELPQNFYSTAFYADKAIEFIGESKTKKQPFFHFLSFTAPHWPLQVPDSALQDYKGKYDEGYEKLAVSRLEGAKRLGIIPKKTSLPALSPNVKPWEELSEDEKQKHQKAMEIYASMIEQIDVHTGRVLQYLKDIGEFENTLIIFMADNGAEGNSIMGLRGTGKWVAETFDNSLQNMGRIDSYVELGTGWAQASSMPFKWYKAFSTEGGVRVPAIFHYPKFNKPAGTIHHDFLSVLDIAPTFLELAGVEHPGTSYQGRDIFPMNGISMLPWLKGNTSLVHEKEKAHVWELYGRRAVRKGAWKAEWMEPPYGSNEWELYNLEEDLGQQQNIAEKFPGKLDELQGIWENYAKEKEVVLPSYPTAYAKESYWREE